MRRELKLYGADLDKKKEIVALSKCDALDKETLEERAEALKKAAKKKPLVLSAVSGEGMREALFALGKEIGRGKKQEKAATEAPKAWRP